MPKRGESTATYHGQPTDNGKDRQCEAALAKDGRKRKQGERCPNPPIRGGNVCLGHGAKAKQVRESAQLRLARLVDPSIDLIAGVIQPRTKAEKQAVKEAGGVTFQVKTGQDVLDRNGYKGKTELSVVTSAVNPSELSEEQLLSILALREQLTTRKASDSSESQE